MFKPIGKWTARQVIFLTAICLSAHPIYNRLDRDFKEEFEKSILQQFEYIWR